MVKQPDDSERPRKRRSKAKPAPRRYTVEDHQRVQAVYEAEGPREAARQSGVPLKTVTNWAKRLGWSFEATGPTAAAVEAVRARIAAKRATLAEGFLDAAREALERRAKPHIELKVVSDGQVLVPQEGGGAIWQKGGSHVEHVELPGPTPTGYREYMVAAGIAVDKMRLELGESTDRKDFVHSGSVALQGVPDEELKTALDRVLRKLGS